MSIQLPQGTDYLNLPDHALSHRVFANDDAAPVQSINVDSTGRVYFGTDENFSWNQTDKILNINRPGGITAGYETEALITNEFVGGGVAQGWSDDDEYWTYTFTGGFTFDFYGTTYTSCFVGSNGIITFGAGADSSYDINLANTSKGAIIAPCATDLYTDDGDIYITQTATTLIIRWDAKDYDDDDPINFEVVMSSNGDVKFNYGSQTGVLGDATTVGISSGDGSNYTYSVYDDQRDFNNVQTSYWEFKAADRTAGDIAIFKSGGETLFSITDSLLTYRQRANVLTPLVRIEDSDENEALSITVGQSGKSNLFIGKDSASGVLSTAQNNTSLGVSALSSITSGGSNAAFGKGSLGDLTSGTSNTGVGNGTLTNLTTGSNNTAIGNAALQVTETGANNVAIGTLSLGKVTTGGQNTGIGYYSGQGITTGSDNVVIGFESFRGTLTGNRNVSIGKWSGRNVSSTSSDNLFLGYRAGYGVSGQTIGNSNTFIGSDSGLSITTAAQNMGSGSGSLSSLTTGQNNVALGFCTLNALTTGSGNTAIGYKCGELLSTNAEDCILIGKNLDLPAGTATAKLSIGNLIFGTNVDAELENISTGSVGIGIYTPGSRLTVKGTGTTDATSSLNVTDSSDTSILFVRDDGNVGIGKIPTTDKLEVAGNLRIGNSEADTDYTLTFDGETNDGVITWKEDEDYFEFGDDIYLSAGEGIKQTDFIDFNLSATPDNVEGRIHWDDDEGTLEVGYPGGNVMLQVGQEGLVRVKNNSGVDIKNGNVVYTTGSLGQRLTVALADNTDSNKILVLGIATEDIDDNGVGYIAIWGKVKGDTAQPINTSTFIEGDKLYLNSAGTWTKTHPVNATDAIVIVGWVKRVHASQGELYITRPQSFTIGNEFDGVLRQSVINKSTGTSAGSGFTTVNDESHRATFGIGGSNHSAFPDTTILYGEGYGDNWYAVDGAKDHVWFTDPTDSHDNSSLSYERMRIKSGGGVVIKADASQTNKLLDITDSSDTSLTWITANGRLQTDIGIRTSAREWGTSLDCFAYGSTTTLKSGTLTGSYDHTGNAKGETVFIDSTNSQFEASDVGKFLIIQSGTYIGAKAVITRYIDADTVQVWGAGWDADLTSVSYKTTILPTIAVGDDNNILLNMGTMGDTLLTSDLSTGWTSSANTSSFFKTTFLAGESDIDHMRFEIDADGNSNVDGLQIAYKTGAMTTGDASQVQQISIDETEATGGHIDGLLIETTDSCSSCEKDAVHIGVGFDNALTVSGATAEDPDYGYETTSGTSTDRVNGGTADTTAFLESSASDLAFFESNGDDILIGSDSMFEILEVILTTGASKNCQLEFRYSKAGGNWTILPGVDDATQGMQNSGIIDWSAPADWTKDDEDIDGNAITEAYYIAITRTYSPALVVKPVEDYFKTFAERAGETGMRVTGQGVIKLPYLTAIPSSPENGMIWMESDGLHTYYGGAEHTLT